MVGLYACPDMDPILAANRLPSLAERATRAAIAAHCLGRTAGRRVTPRALVNDALIRFERAVQRVAGDGIRPALLFAERDRIVRELRTFAESRLALRLVALHRRDVVAFGEPAHPFDAIVRGRRGGVYGLIFRRLAPGSDRLETMRAMRAAALEYREEPLRGVLVYDLRSGDLLSVVPRASEYPAA